MYDLIIIGSGPAGLSAAVYGKRAGLNLLIIEEKPMSGGQILNTYEVDNYLGLPGISGFDMGMTFRQHAEKLGAEFLEATVHSVEERGDYKCVYAGDQELETRTVIFATGAEHAKLGVPGEEIKRHGCVLLCYLRRSLFPGQNGGCGRRRRRGAGGCHLPGENL